MCDPVTALVQHLRCMRIRRSRKCFRCVINVRQTVIYTRSEWEYFSRVSILAGIHLDDTKLVHNHWDHAIVRVERQSEVLLSNATRTLVL